MLRHRGATIYYTKRPVMKTMVWRHRGATIYYTKWPFTPFTRGRNPPKNSYTSMSQKDATSRSNPKIAFGVGNRCTSMSSHLDVATFWLALQMITLVARKSAVWQAGSQAGWWAGMVGLDWLVGLRGWSGKAGLGRAGWLGRAGRGWAGLGSYGLGWAALGWAGLAGLS